jgi:hypothetical protein
MMDTTLTAGTPNSPSKSFAKALFTEMATVQFGNLPNHLLVRHRAFPTTLKTAQGAQPGQVSPIRSLKSKLEEPVIELI